jgi:NAD(P)-dependent dehydrogenase (short-subunit alcohol dehydrogenase family)
MTVPGLSIPDPKPFGELLSLHGKCAVVTGGSRGLGEAMVRRLAEAGASVVLTGRHVKALKRVEKDVAAAGGRAVGVQADVADLGDDRKVIDQAVERFGGVDILVNNAATFQKCLTVEVTPEFWDHTLGTDLRGAFFLSQAAAKLMIEQGHGGHGMMRDCAAATGLPGSDEHVRDPASSSGTRSGQGHRDLGPAPPPSGEDPLPRGDQRIPPHRITAVQAT